MEQLKISKKLAYILRHKPDAYNITLDEVGWASLPTVIKALDIDFHTIKHIIDTDDKKRYTIDEENAKIRANQGHSIEVNLKLNPIKPPLFLYHGTVAKYVNNIRRDGLRKMRRNYVHLSKDIETATKVGERRGNPIILKIFAMDMYNDGYNFYLSENGVYLTNRVPIDYIVEKL